MSAGTSLLVVDSGEMLWGPFQGIDAAMKWIGEHMPTGWAIKPIEPVECHCCEIKNAIASTNIEYQGWRRDKNSKWEA